MVWEFIGSACRCLLGVLRGTRESSPGTQLTDVETSTATTSTSNFHEAIFFPDENLPCRNYLVGTECRRKVCNFAHYDTGLVRIIRVLNAAQHSLDVCVFSITQDDLAGALLEAHHRGVSVRILTDDEQMKAGGSDIERLRDAGILVLHDSSEKLHMHHKFAIVDSKVLINGSFNWTAGAVKGNDENVIISHHAGIAGRFSKEFNRLWEGFLQGDPGRAVPGSFDGNIATLFFPDAGGNVALVKKELMEARRTIDVAVFTLTLDVLCDSLIKQHQNGVHVRVITDHRQSSCKGADAQRMRDAGLEVHSAGQHYFMHNKFAVVDGTIVINGSFNWTFQAAHGNEENLVIYRNAFELATQFSTVFERIWGKYT